MQAFILMIHVVVGVILITLVLLQQGKGAAMGASFGGTSSSVFGSVGPASFLTKMTFILGAIFFATTLGLGLLTSHSVNKMDLFSSLEIEKKHTEMVAKER